MNQESKKQKYIQKKETRTLFVRMPVQEFEDVRRISKKEGKYMSEVVREMVQNGLMQR